ncbi:M15 family metallopeptidase [Alkaliphilus oremlandii]|uniref:Peptidase M15B and M15C DD-carboxypeptidase VanY/endolysin n=1 Tax=Alkaliphilus oremlandii (strain OhILAs) TaxID=350688 RepID=A8MM73_ALKOO|nr:M15 family metallopeptidase [Alkaliphilus oremlandii]ABW18240.1 peptidase M15B and M15C DD-carboxypeptidase VanY/endolysin [Alkaliphilus oremlandii OhILAs]
MAVRNRRKRKKNNRFKVMMRISILLIIASATFLCLTKLPNYVQRVIAGSMVEEAQGVEENNGSNEVNNQELDTSEDNKATGVDNNPKGSENKKDNEAVQHDEKILVENTNDILVVVNKKRHVASDYKPEDLVVPNVKFSFSGEHEKKYMRQEAATSLEKLFEQAKEEEIHLFAVSGYRSYSTQERVFNGFVNQYGEEKANKFSARPGESEHHTGLAMDVSSQSAEFRLLESFGDMPEGKWLKENAHKFGFIIRYLKEKTDITGYTYEPWHIRYVGKAVAEEIYNAGITLEEYLGLE